jgi:hypothetical protein
MLRHRGYECAPLRGAVEYRRAGSIKK